MMSAGALVEAIHQDSLVGVRKLLEKSSRDLNEWEIIDNEFDVDDPDEVPLVFWAIRQGVSLEMLSLFAEHGMDPAWVNREGVGILDMAIRYHRMDIAQWCVAQGIGVDVSRRCSGLTPLMLAASSSDYAMVDYLIGEGALIDTADKRGIDVIEYARVLGQNKMVDYLEKRKASQKEKQEV